MTTRSEFIARVRSGLGTPAPGAAVPSAPAVDEQLVRLTSPTDDLVTMFASRAATTGMVVHRCPLIQLASTVHSLVAHLGAGQDRGRVVVDQLDADVASPIADALARRGAEIIDPLAARSLDPQFDAAIGITGVVAAIAETGTLVLVSDDQRSRGTFMVPPIHVAIVRESQIIPDMLDVWRIIGVSPPTAVTFITGPSKTADIEGILVTGVHGPGAVHVVLVS